MKAIGYLRVSTEDQAREGVSLEAQEAKVRAYGELKDWDLEIIKDEGRSGKDWNREGVRLLWERINGNSVNHLIIYKLDRLSRSTLDLLQIAEELNKKDIGLHSISENVDTTSSMGKFFFTLIGAMAELERNITSERTRAALAHKKTKAEWVGRPPFGFMIENGVLAENSVHMQIIRKAKRMRRSGASLRHIARHFNVPKDTLYRAIKTDLRALKARYINL